MGKKEIERENIIRRIKNFCKKHKVHGSYNNPAEDKLVSFYIKDNKLNIVKE